MGSVDQNNSTVFPLLAGGVFEGLYTSTTNFSEILISVETDTTFELIVNFSTNNGQDIGLIKTYTVSVPAGTAFTYSIKPYLRYYQVVLTNTSLTEQTHLRLETILKSVIVYEPDGGSAPSNNVNIVSPLDGSGNVLVSDVLSQSYLSNIASNASIIATNTYTRDHVLLWDAPISADSNTGFIDLTDKQVKLITLYGFSSADTVLTIIFSPDGVDVFKSQYQITVSAGETFGFSIPCNPIYLGIYSSQEVSYKLTLYVDYS